MAYKIVEIEGIGPAIGEKLIQAGIDTVEQLLERGASKKGRQELAATTGIAESKILSFVNMADMFRIKGISTQRSELLHACGVDTVVELATRKPENLHAKMKEVNDEKNLVGQIPSLGQVQDFVDQAKSLARVVTH